MRFGLIVCLVLAMVCGTAYSVTGALSLMNHASDQSVGAGLVVLAVLFIAWSGFLIFC